jgi:hypothetical protein
LVEFIDINEEKIFEIELYKKTSLLKLYIKSTKRTKTDDLLSELTTQTDMSDDDDEEIIKDNEVKLQFSPSKLKLKRELKNYMHTNQFDEERTKIKNNTHEEIVNKKENRRKKTQSSFSLDEEISNQLVQELNKISLNDNEIKNKKRLIKKKENQNLTISNEEKINKQNLEKKILEEKILEQEKEETEHDMIEILITNSKPSFQNNIPISAPNLIRCIQEFKGIYFYNIF